MKPMGKLICDFRVDRRTQDQIESIPTEERKSMSIGTIISAETKRTRTVPHEAR